jgi:hypothetical protein
MRPFMGRSFVELWSLGPNAHGRQRGLSSMQTCRTGKLIGQRIDKIRLEISPLFGARPARGDAPVL